MVENLFLSNMNYGQVKFLEKMDHRDKIFKNWTLHAFKRHLSTPNSFGIVAKLNGQIVGYICYVLRKKSCHVLNLVVDKNLRRLGIGSTLLQSTIVHSRKRMVVKINFLIPEGSLESQLLAKKSGMKCHSIAENYFDHLGENYQNAYCFSLELENSSTNYDSFPDRKRKKTVVLKKLLEKAHHS